MMDTEAGLPPALAVTEAGEQLWERMVMGGPAAGVVAMEMRAAMQGIETPSEQKRRLRRDLLELQAALNVVRRHSSKYQMPQATVLRALPEGLQEVLNRLETA